MNIDLIFKKEPQSYLTIIEKNQWFFEHSKSLISMPQNRRF